MRFFPDEFPPVLLSLKHSVRQPRQLLVFHFDCRGQRSPRADSTTIPLRRLRLSSLLHSPFDKPTADALAAGMNGCRCRPLRVSRCVAHRLERLNAFRAAAAVCSAGTCKSGVWQWIESREALRDLSTMLKDDALKHECHTGNVLYREVCETGRSGPVYTFAWADWGVTANTGNAMVYFNHAFEGTLDELNRAHGSESPIFTRLLQLYLLLKHDGLDRSLLNMTGEVVQSVQSRSAGTCHAGSTWLSIESSLRS